MKKTILLTLSAVLFASPLLAQPEHARRAARTILTDDDDGKVEVWRRGEVTGGTVGSATVRQPLFQLIFAGPGWSPAARDAIANSLRLLALPPGVSPATIAGTHDLPMPATINDLGIQSLLDRAMRDGSLPLRDDNVIHIVVLSPGVASTLGASRAGRDYDSYHSHFHAHDVDVRYVVVPWQDDAAALQEAAANSALRAVLSADGN